MKGKENKIRGKPSKKKERGYILTPRQQRFVQEYIVDNNGAAAARRAGYSPRTAKAMAHRLLTNVYLQEAIKKATERQEIRTEITADKVLQEIAKVAFLNSKKLYDDNGNIKKLSELDDDTSAAIASVSVTDIQTDGEISGKKTDAVFWNKLKALEMLARHFGLLVDKKEISGPGGDALEIRWMPDEVVDNDD